MPTRDRAGYLPYELTIAEGIESGMFAGDEAELMRIIAAYTFDGHQLLGRPWRIRNNSVHEQRYAAKDAELWTAAITLARLGERDVVLVGGEAPDFTATFASGLEMRLEVSEVTASPHRTNAMQDLRIALRDAVDAEPSLLPADAYVHFNFGPMVDRPPTARERAALVREAMAVLRAGEYRRWLSPRLFGIEESPTMHRFGTWVHVGTMKDSTRGVVDFGDAGFTWLDTGLVDVACERLEAKRGLQYRGAGPLWLLLPITDERGLFHRSVAAFQALTLDISPFDRIVLSYDGALGVVDRR